MQGLDFESLLHAIPKEWKDIITNDNISANLQPVRRCNVYYNNERKEIGTTNTREVQWHFIDKISKRPTSEAKWHKKTELNLTENERKSYIKCHTNSHEIHQ